MPLPFTKDLTMWSPISIYENTNYFSNFYLDQPSGDAMINESLMPVDLDPFAKIRQMGDFTTSVNNNENICYLCTATSANQRQLQASPSMVSLKSTAAAAISFPLTWRHYQKNTKTASAQATPSPLILNHFRDCQPPPKADKMRLVGRTSPALLSPTHHYKSGQRYHYNYVPHYAITTPKICSSSLFSHCTSTLSSSCSCSFFQKCWLWWKSILQFKKKYIHPLNKRKP